MARLLADLSSLGPVTAARLIEIGVTSEAELRAAGAVAAYRMLRFRFGKAVTLNALYGLDAALRNVHWRVVDDARKAELRAELGEG